MTEQLKPCPFCGNDRNIGMRNEKHNHSGGYFISCPECDASTGLRYAMGDDPRPLLIEAWNRRAQPAQAVPVLTDAEIHAADPIPQNRFDQERIEFARRVEQAVRAKMGVAVPMTHMQIVTLWGHRSDGPSTPEIVSFARLVERHHGIVGKEDGNV